MVLGFGFLFRGNSELHNRVLLRLRIHAFDFPDQLIGLQLVTSLQVIFKGLYGAVQFLLLHGIDLFQILHLPQCLQQVLIVQFYLRILERSKAFLLNLIPDHLGYLHGLVLLYLLLGLLFGLSLFYSIEQPNLLVSRIEVV